MASKTVGFAGKSGVGKTTAARYLWETRGYAVASFAGAVKMVAYLLWGFTEEQLFGDKRDTVDERYGYPPRMFLQGVGQKMRELDSNVWVRSLIRGLEAEDTPVAIDDVRYPNEVEAIQKAGGKVYLIFREDAPTVLEHESEKQDLEPLVDGVIRNDSTLDDFLYTVKKVTQ